MGSFGPTAILHPLVMFNWLNFDFQILSPIHMPIHWIGCFINSNTPFSCMALYNFKVLASASFHLILPETYWDWHSSLSFLGSDLPEKLRHFFRVTYWINGSHFPTYHSKLFYFFLDPGKPSPKDWEMLLMSVCDHVCEVYTCVFP